MAKKDKSKKKDKPAKKEMRSQSLAVKYRPRRLEDLVGQKDVVATIRGALKTKNIPAAYLLAGGTGLGKTTTARIIARYLNCDTNDACGKCKNCETPITAHPDYEELNIANTRGIDDIREIVRRSVNRPRMGRFRVILLDECHQLTPQAAETLLKPLEEPAPATVWILATTDPQKLKPTIVKRCTTLLLKNIPEKEVTERLQFIAKKEGIKVKDKLWPIIYKGSEGHMRNAIQLLEAVGAAQAGGVTDTKELIAAVESAAATSTDPALLKITYQILAAALGLSLKSFWKAAAFIKGEEVSLVTQSFFLLTYIIESGTAGSGPFVWHTAEQRGLRDALKGIGFSVSDDYNNLARASQLLNVLIELRNELVTFSGNPRTLIQGRIANFIVEQKRLQPAKDKPKKK